MVLLSSSFTVEDLKNFIEQVIKFYDQFGIGAAIFLPFLANNIKKPPIFKDIENVVSGG